MKNAFLLLLILLGEYRSFAQIPLSKALIIDPSGNNIQDAKGNMRVLGILESNIVKIPGLATGNPLVVRPVYANVDGTLITGYKLNYLSIPPVAFRLSWEINTDGQTISFGKDIALYTTDYVTFAEPSTSRKVLAPLSFPHGSKLSAIKLNISIPSNKTISGAIVRKSLNNEDAGEELFTFTTLLSSSNSVAILELPINLIEIDNQNYTYTLILTPSDNSWLWVSIRGASIEYRDF